MTSNRLRAAAGALILSAMAGVLASCGGDTIVLVGDGDGGDSKTKVTVKGNLDTFPPPGSRDIVVFVYTIDDDSDRCPCPPDPSNSTVGRSAVLSPGETEFEIPGVAPGPLGIVFLLDGAGVNADGKIDSGDEIAILDDVDCELDDVSGNLTATLKDIDVSFSATPVDQVPADPPTQECKDSTDDPPAEGRARADLITQKTTTNSDN